MKGRSGPAFWAGPDFFRATSEDKSQPELNLPRVHPWNRRTRHSEIGTAQSPAGRIECVLVEQVEELAPELQVGPLEQVSVFGDGDVQVAPARIAEGVAPQVAGVVGHGLSVQRGNGNREEPANEV